jgi:glycosyltransferase involved in cell wall biosynthesis
LSSVSSVSDYRTYDRLRNCRWTQIQSHIDRRYGGITASVPRLSAASEACANFESPIVGFCEPDETFADAGVSVTKLERGRLRWMTDSALRSRLRDMISASDGLHIHGIWEEHSSTAAAMAREARKPYVVSAHGMLDEWAVKSKWLKKALYSSLIERPNLARANCLRALTRTEVDDYRRFGLRNPIAIIPNGVDTPPAVDPGYFLEAHPDLAGKRIVLFLSRLIYKKGLDLLCRAWASVGPRFPDAHLVIAGPDYGAQASIERLIDELGIRSSVTLPGMLSGDIKNSALAASEAFILPSRSEGFSVAALEAIATGVPVILTRQCNFPEVAQSGCGWVVEPDVRQLQDALDMCLLASPSERARMGANGRALAGRRYSWRVIGEQMAEVYDWLLGGPAPTSVEMF